MEDEGTFIRTPTRLIIVFVNRALRPQRCQRTAVQRTRKRSRPRARTIPGRVVCPAAQLHYPLAQVAARESGREHGPLEYGSLRAHGETRERLDYGLLGSYLVTFVGHTTQDAARFGAAPAPRHALAHPADKCAERGRRRQTDTQMSPNITIHHHQLTHSSRCEVAARGERARVT